jgi:peptidoglycan/xylan/chitin deacetylase (PgdA/CDA1 family)
MQTQLTVVMYHYVRDIQASRFPTIKALDTALFTEQLLFFKKHYTVVSMEDVISSIENSISLPQHCLLLTFDDGYTDHYETVFPLLKKFNLRGAFYPPVRAITERIMLDVNKLHFVLATSSNETLLLAEIETLFNHYQETHRLNSFQDLYKQYATSDPYDSPTIVFIKRLLQDLLPLTLRTHLLDTLFQKKVGEPLQTFSDKLYMTENQLKDMVRDGMHVGCHGNDHFWWTSLDKAAQYKEISSSVDFLKKLGVNMNTFTTCYPYGAYNDDSLETLQHFNCKLAFTTYVAVADLSKHHRLTLPRLDTNHLPKDNAASPNEWYSF